MPRELLSFFQDGALLRAFEVVAEERKIRYGAFRETLGIGPEDALERLGKLEEAGYVKSQDAPGQVEDLKWYSITARGLAAERDIHRLELVP